MFNARISGDSHFTAALSGSERFKARLSDNHELTADFSDHSNLTAHFSENDNFRAHLSETIHIPSGDPFTGRYEYIPTDFEQIIPIAGLVATRNIKIRAVPDNWGQIFWDGSVITVR